MPWKAGNQEYLPFSACAVRYSRSGNGEVGAAGPGCLDTIRTACSSWYKHRGLRRLRRMAARARLSIVLHVHRGTGPRRTREVGTQGHGGRAANCTACTSWCRGTEDWEGWGVGPRGPATRSATGASGAARRGRGRTARGGGRRIQAEEEAGAEAEGGCEPLLETIDRALEAWARHREAPGDPACLGQTVRAVWNLALAEDKQHGES